MIKLFESNAVEYSTNGLGALDGDALFCTVTEERNGTFELEMDYPVDGRRYSDIKPRRIIVAKPNPFDEPQAFRIYSITKPMNGVITINAEHISYDLAGIPVSPFEADSCTEALQAIKRNSVTDHPFEFSTDKPTQAEMYVDVPTNARSLLGGIEGSVLDTYGGEYIFDNFSVCLKQDRGSDNGVTIKYGKNLTSVEQDENCSNLYTHVYPYWFSDEGGLVQLSTYILPTGLTLDRNRIFVLDCSSYLQRPNDYQSADNTPWTPTQNELKSFAEKYIAANKRDLTNPSVSISVSFYQLVGAKEYSMAQLLETVKLCDWVTVQFPKLGIDVKAQCVTAVYNCLTDKYESLELGNPHANLATNLASSSNELPIAIDKAKTEMQVAIDRATKLISGGLGGNVIMHSSDPNSKYPDEILILCDSEDLKTAKKIWRWNKNGLGFSSTGYDGEFGLAMTSDGAIVADMITSGKLSSSLISTNSITAQMLSEEYVESVNNSINKATQAIENKVNFDKVIASINMSKEQIKILAKYISLEGTVTANEYFKIYTDGSMETNKGNIGGFLIENKQLVGSTGTNRVELGVYGLQVKGDSGSSSGPYTDIQGGKIVFGNSFVSVTGRGNEGGHLSSTELKMFGPSRNVNVIEKNNSSATGEYNRPARMCGMRTSTIAVENTSIFDGQLQATDSISCSGWLSVDGTKNRVVYTDDYGKVYLHAYETPTPTFADSGTSQIGDDGYSYIAIDPIFLETVSGSYRVFLQGLRSNVVLEEKQSGYFVVSGTPGTEFYWNLEFTQRDFENLRFTSPATYEPDNKAVTDVYECSTVYKDNAEKYELGNQHAKEVLESRKV